MTDLIETDEAVVDDAGDASARRRRWPWIVGALFIAAVIAIVALVVTSNDATDEDTAAPADTVTVATTDLVVTETMDGTLGFGEADTFSFRSSQDGIDTVPGGLSGIVTKAPEAGTVVESGDVLYEVNAQPVVVLTGDVPVYRTLDRRSSDGHDVELLEQALVDLGYDPDGDITIDEDFTSATENAVEDLQEAIGADVDGRLAFGELIFAPGPTYVAEALVAVGDQVQSGQPVIATSAAPAGTLTFVAAEGDVIDQGDVLYRTDGRPTMLVLGDLPVYRTLADGDEGDDVVELQQALIDLGYLDGEPTGTYDAETVAAVITWQAAAGAHPDGVVNLGETLVWPEPIRVGDVLSTEGTTVNNGTPILAATASSTFVSVQLDTADRDLVDVGDAVTVELPDGTVVDATVTTIGSVAQSGQQGSSYFDMEVAIENSEATIGLDGAPVDVSVVTDEARGALAVPVTALVALAEGGYAVEVADDAGVTHLVGVETGLFADGLVEVSGAGLEAGMDVVVP